MAKKLQNMLKATGGLVDIHVQRRDYGYMLSNRKIKNKKEGIELAVREWNKLIESSARENSVTRERFLGNYFKGYPYEITIMPKDFMKGTVMFEDFGAMPEEGVIKVTVD